MSPGRSGGAHPVGTTSTGRWPPTSPPCSEMRYQPGGTTGIEIWNVLGTRYPMAGTFVVWPGVPGTTLPGLFRPCSRRWVATHSVPFQHSHDAPQPTSSSSLRAAGSTPMSSLAVAPAVIGLGMRVRTPTSSGVRCSGGADSHPKPVGSASPLHAAAITKIEAAIAIGRIAPRVYAKLGSPLVGTDDITLPSASVRE
jgi:hypothetical protein